MQNKGKSFQSWPDDDFSSDDAFAPGDAEFCNPKSSVASDGPSLKARAVALLSRREYSRQELARKLSSHAESPEALEKVLDELARENWQSDERFVQNLVHRQAGKHGTSRILHTLRQHGMDADRLAELGESLRETELDRARDVWKKKFSHPPVDAREYARQLRFLTSRGFSSELLRRILCEIENGQNGDSQNV